jgi:hypothetical protein
MYLRKCRKNSLGVSVERGGAHNYKLLLHLSSFVIWFDLFNVLQKLLIVHSQLKIALF